MLVADLLSTFSALLFLFLGALQVICNGEEVFTVSGTKKEYVVDVWSGNHPFYMNGAGGTMILDEERIRKPTPPFFLSSPLIPSLPNPSPALRPRPRPFQACALPPCGREPTHPPHLLSGCRRSDSSVCLARSPEKFNKKYEGLDDLFGDVKK